MVFTDGHEGSPETGPRLADVGDLSTFGAYRKFDAEGYTISQGKVWPEVFDSAEELANSNWSEQLGNGYTYFRVDGPVPEELRKHMPFGVLNPEEDRPDFPALGRNAALLMERNGEYRHVIANGKVHNLALYGNR